MTRPPRTHDTEVVYRLYETVDELTTVIENARSVPMSASCMVPRDHLLDLLDDLRESLPEDVQAAGAIVEQRTEILQQAQAEAERLTGRTRGESDQLLASARRQRDELLGTARRQRDELLAEAQAAGRGAAGRGRGGGRPAGRRGARAARGADRRGARSSTSG